MRKCSILLFLLVWYFHCKCVYGGTYTGIPMIYDRCRLLRGTLLSLTKVSYNDYEWLYRFDVPWLSFDFRNTWYLVHHSQVTGTLVPASWDRVTGTCTLVPTGSTSSLLLAERYIAVPVHVCMRRQMIHRIKQTSGSYKRPLFLIAQFLGRQNSPFFYPCNWYLVPVLPVAPSGKNT